MKKFLYFLLAVSLLFIAKTPVYADYHADLAVPNLQLTDTNGAAKNEFFVNEPIYVRATYKNIGSGTAENQYTSSGNIWSQIYGNKPDEVPYQTESDVHVYMRLPNNIAPNSTLKFESFPGGVNNSAFEGNKYFIQTKEGTYTARTFVNYDKLAQEWYYGNNQIALKYTVKQYATDPITSATAVCDSGTLTLTMGNHPIGWAKWAIRLDDTSNPWSATSTPNKGDTLVDNYTKNTYSQPATIGITYGWWFHALSSTGAVLDTKSGYVNCVTAPVTNLTSSKSGSTITLSWTGAAGATKYAVRVNDLSNGWGGDKPLSGDIVTNNVTGTSFTFTSQAGHAYNWWVHAINTAGAYSRPSSAFAN